MADAGSPKPDTGPPGSSGGGSDDVISRYVSPGGENVTLIYVLYIGSVFVGLTAIVGIVMAYMNRGKWEGWWESHYAYQIRTFWIGLLYAVVSGLLMVIGIGFLLFFVVAIWALVRCIRGLQWSSRREPVPNPETWLI